ncbi:MAG: LytR C-terminal domain-containing protein [Sphingomicrobium sp.]
MHKGAKLLAAAAVITAGGCAKPGEVQIRASAAPLSATARPVPFRLAEAMGQLALGNVALALESFRKALRDEPGSVAAMTGVADCYDRMGRFDLSRGYYEAALAITPADPALLTAFAASLDAQGKRGEASTVRLEVMSRQAAVSSPAPTVVAQAHLPAIVTQAPAPAIFAQAPPPTVVAPAPISATAPAIASSAIVGRSVTLALPPARPFVAAPFNVAPLDVATADPPVPAIALPPVALPAVPAAEIANADPVESIPAPLMPLPTVPAVELVTETLAPPADRLAIASLIDAFPGPRLERMSLGEVALVTHDGPRWRPLLVARTATSSAIRFVPLRTASASPLRIRLLNAARHQGLAARTRNLLATRGWDKLAIGDASHVRQYSLILYPPRQRAAAQRLAAQFGFALAGRPRGRDLVVLLGRDSIRSGVRSRA